MQVIQLFHGMTGMTGAKGFFNEQQFRNALYMIDIGQNDLADSFSKNHSYAQVVKIIPLVIGEIKKAVKVSLVYTLSNRRWCTLDVFSLLTFFRVFLKKCVALMFEQTLYDQGGRKFWIHNTGPLGCLPQKLSLVQHKEGDVDTAGCISSYNSAAQLFNAALLHSCQEMKSELADATIVHVDIYSIKYDIISHGVKHGKFYKKLKYY